MDYSRYIDVLYEGQNIGAQECQRNLTPKSYYKNLVLSVDKVLRENPEASLSELRNILIKDSHIEDKIRDFCLGRKKTPGLVLSVRTNNYYHDFYAGNRQEVINQDGNMVPKSEEIGYDALFDLASVTKLFTSIATLKLVQLEMIDINDEVTKYAPQFTNLRGTKIIDLLTFKGFETDTRVDSAGSAEEAEQILFNARPKRYSYGQSSYNDFGAMILKYVIEAVTNMPYYTFLNECLLAPLGMKDTVAVLDDEQKQRAVSTNGDVRVYQDGRIIQRNYIEKGVSSDDKARVLGQPIGNLSGHAGLFSTAQDMEALTKSFVSSSFISYELRDEMARNHSGYLYKKPDGGIWATQFLGMLCYAKNPIMDITEVMHYLSGNSFASSGWAGNYYTVDPINGIGVFLGSNRTHNRVSINTQSSTVQVGPNGEKYIFLPDGRRVIDSSRYVYERGFITETAVELALKLKILEDILKINEPEMEEEHTKII